MKKWKEGKEKGEIAIREREMRESENGKKQNDTLEDKRKRRAAINENGKTHATINAWHFGYPSASGKVKCIGNTSFCKSFTVVGCDIFGRESGLTTT